MNIEIGGISIIKIETQPNNAGTIVNLRKPIIVHTDSGSWGFTTEVFSRVCRRKRECQVANGLIKFPLPPYKEGTN